MKKEDLVCKLETTKTFFDRSTGCLTDEDSEFAPKEGMLTVAQQIAHVAQSVEWFMEGAFSPQGFDMDFEKHFAKIGKVKTVTEARKYLDKAFSEAISKVEGSTEEELNIPIVENPVMSGCPRNSAIGGIEEHTSHHRGSLAVYSRLLDKEPKMPYA